MQDRPVILGIHGLANKPPREEKQTWWRTAIREGLARNLGHDPGDRLCFDFVYWADLRYGEPVAAGRNREPYYPARGRGPLPSPEAGPPPGPTLTDRVYRVLEWLQEKSGRLLVDDLFIEVRLDDLWGYYKDAAFRDAARDRLRTALERHAGKPLLLAAHSMGSLIAYDALRLMEADGRPPRVAHLVTMGAPLGLAEVKHRIGPNAAGVRAVDCPVVNAYRRPRGGRNPHKSYGYLRTPEFSRAVAAFLAAEAEEGRVEAEVSA